MPQVIDTNVPVNANRALDPDAPDELLGCIRSCVDAIESVVKLGGLVLDQGDEIFNEYRQNLSLSGQPGQGDLFMKWVHDHRWSFPEEDRVLIRKTEDSYQEFPAQLDLQLVDPSDRKFIAVANAHSGKPPILQSTDSKWWGWKDELEKAGITVEFLCAEWIKKKYQQKMED